MLEAAFTEGFRASNRLRSGSTVVFPEKTGGNVWLAITKSNLCHRPNLTRGREQIPYVGVLQAATPRLGALKCIDWKAGRQVWEEKMSNRTSMIYADGHFFCLGENGWLRVLRATADGYEETGRIDKKNAAVMPSYPAWAAPVLSHGLLYVRGKHELICYDLLSE